VRVLTKDRDVRVLSVAAENLLAEPSFGGIVVSGRLIAYNWFDCDIQPQPAFINWASECAAVLADALQSRPMP